MCNVLCEQELTQEHKDLLKERIDNEYTGAAAAHSHAHRRRPLLATPPTFPRARTRSQLAGGRFACVGAHVRG